MCSLEILFLKCQSLLLQEFTRATKKNLTFFVTLCNCISLYYYICIFYYKPKPKTMTIEEILKEVEVVSNVISHDVKVDLTYLNVEGDDEIQIYAKENDLVLHHPDSMLPYYWFVQYFDNISVIFKGRIKKVNVIY